MRRACDCHVWGSKCIQNFSWKIWMGYWNGVLTMKIERCVRLPGELKQLMVGPIVCSANYATPKALHKGLKFLYNWKKASPITCKGRQCVELFISWKTKHRCWRTASVTRKAGVDSSAVRKGLVFSPETPLPPPPGAFGEKPITLITTLAVANLVILADVLFIVLKSPSNCITSFFCLHESASMWH